MISESGEAKAREWAERSVSSESLQERGTANCQGQNANVHKQVEKHFTSVGTHEKELKKGKSFLNDQISKILDTIF